VANLILVRHGESSGNRDRIFATDPHSLPLTDLGYAQARAAARLIVDMFQPKLVVSSPFLRAHETARVIAEGIDAPLEVEPNLYERDVGVYRGRSYDSLVSAPGYAPASRWNWRPPEGESYEDVLARVGPILDRLARDNSATDVVVVSHGGVMVTLWAHIVGTWDSSWTPPNCGIVQVEHGADGYRMPRVIGESHSARDAGG